jgi:hypothetical protein
MIDDIRVWCVVNPPNDIRHYYGFYRIDEAKNFVEILANEQLTSDKIISNIFGIEVLEDGEWSEVDDDF